MIESRMTSILYTICIYVLALLVFFRLVRKRNLSTLQKTNQVKWLKSSASYIFKCYGKLDSSFFFPTTKTRNSGEKSTGP